MTVPATPPREPSILALLGALLGGAACAGSPAPGGPLATRNQHPAQLLAPYLEPLPATVLSAGAAAVRADSAYTSLWLSGSGRGNSFVMDGELLRSAVDARVGLGGGFEVHAELAAGYATGGSLDRFVIDWHEFFGLPDQNRDRFPRDAYEVRAMAAGQTVYELRGNELEWFDLPIGLRWQVPLPADEFAVALRAVVELPTGREAAGFGNGEVDFAVGLDAEWRTPDWAATVHAGHGFVGNTSLMAAAGVELGDVTTAGAGLELAVWDGLRLLAHTTWEKSTLRELGFPRVADDQWLLWLGGRISLGPATSLELGLGEDLAGFIAPDFSIYVGVLTTFGGAVARPAAD